MYFKYIWVYLLFKYDIIQIFELKSLNILYSNVWGQYDFLN